MRRTLLTVLVAFAAACGSSPAAPAPTGVLVVSVISPSTLSTTGGATVTITGTGFASDAVVKVDGVSLTGATITPTSITVTAPSHAVGAGSFAVTTGGKTGSLSATFVAPSGLNAAPVISNLRINGPGNKPPSPFVDLSSNVALSATVTDVETSPAALVYTWTVAAGTISGTGASVTWNLPASLPVTPSAQTVTLTVTELFTENGVQHRNVVAASLLADAHDSSAEILDKGFRFLDLFSQSSIAPGMVLADFDQTFSGYADELSDTTGNRTKYLELPGYSIQRLPPVTFNFGGSCTYHAFNDTRGPYRGDACSSLDVHWFVRFRIDVFDENGVLVGPAGSMGETIGRDFVTAVFRSGQWKLVASGFLGTATVTFPNGTVKQVASLPGLGGSSRVIKKQ